MEGADQHALYPIFVRMDIIPWVKLACQRVGEENGPSSPEYEVSDTELDWFDIFLFFFSSTSHPH